jgi:hypothetical protein
VRWTWLQQAMQAPADRKEFVMSLPTHSTFSYLLKK